MNVMPGLGWTYGAEHAPLDRSNWGALPKIFQAMYLPSPPQRASQRTLKREDHVTGAGFCPDLRRAGIMDASIEAYSPAEALAATDSLPAKPTRAATDTKQAANKMRATFFCRDEEEVDIGEICSTGKRHGFAFASNYLFTSRNSLSITSLAREIYSLAIFFRR
jgi:hypothetical protein